MAEHESHGVIVLYEASVWYCYGPDNDRKEGWKAGSRKEAINTIRKLFKANNVVTHEIIHDRRK